MSTNTAIVKDTALDYTIVQTITLLERYSFDLQTTAEATVNRWLKTYNPHWLRLAVIEALYFGRYKAVSAEQILQVWQRRGASNIHFNHDFERLICRNLPRHLTRLASDHSASLLPQTPTRLRKHLNQPKAKTQSYDKATSGGGFEFVQIESNHNHLSVVSQALPNQSSAKSLNSHQPNSKVTPNYQKQEHEQEQNNRNHETSAQFFDSSIEDSGFLLKLKAVANLDQ